MSIFPKFIVRSDKSYGPTDDYWYSPFAGPTKAGVDVNEFVALNFSAVYNAITIISQTVGSLPLHLFKRTERITQKAVNRPGYGVLHSVANPEMTAMTYRETTSAHELSWGNSYSEIVRNGMGQIVELWPIPPNRVTVRRAKKDDGTPGPLFYEINVGTGQPVFLPRERILHIPGLGFDGLIGYSVLTKARESIALGMATEEFGARFFGQGTAPIGSLETPEDLGDGREDFAKEFQKGYAGLGKSHSVMILDRDMKYKPIGVKPEDAQFLQTRAFSVVEVARWFNIEPMKLKDHSKSSFNNITSLQTSHVIDCIRPWLVRREQNYNMQMLTPKERRMGYYWEHVVEGLLRGDWAARAEYYSKIWMIGGITNNEIREKENMNTIGQEGDVYLEPMNMQPAGTEPPPAEPKKIEGDNIRNAHRALIISQLSRVITKRNKGDSFETSRTFAKKILYEPACAFASTLNRNIEVRGRLDNIIDELINENIKLIEKDVGELADTIIERIGDNHG